MPDTQPNEYLRSAVLTASSEQLQLMLYDGAIRFSSQAREAIVRGDIEESFNLLLRAQKIVSEMQNGLRHEVAPELCAQMASLYSFVFSKLVEANLNKNLESLNDALKVLRLQRETWAILVEKVQQVRAEQPTTSPPPTSQHAPTAHTTLSVEG